MQYHVLGRSGVRVSRICLGTALFGVAPLEDDVDALVGSALDLGINCFDCANTYGNRVSFDRDGVPPADQRKSAEELLGSALKGRRDDVVVCTKVSEPVGTGPNDGSNEGGGLSRYHIMREVERSLRRLGTDRIDVYHAHRPDPLTPLDETMTVFDELISQGKVRYAALSNFGGWQLTWAALAARHLTLRPPVANQVMYNMVFRDVEKEVVPAATEFGLSLTVFSPLAGGLLAGTEGLNRPVAGFKRFGASFDYPPAQRKAAEQLESLGAEWGYAPSQLALAWVLSRPAVASAIVGAETPRELAVSATATEVDLDEKQLEVLDGIGRPPPELLFD